MVFSRNVVTTKRVKLSSVLNFKAVDNFGSYLGFLLDFPNSKVNSFNFIMDQGTNF